MTAPRALVLLVWLALVAGCAEPLTSGLDRDEANHLVVRLEQHGIAAHLEEARSAREGDAWTVLVDPGDLPAARAVLVATRPRALEQRSGADRDDEPASALLGPSPRQQHRREERRLEHALARSLERLDGVREAHVHLSLPARDWSVPGRDDPPSRASVLLLIGADTQDTAAGLRADAVQLVVGAVPGLEPAAVSAVLRAAPEPPALTGVPFAQLGPWRVARGSLTSMRWAFGALIALLVAQSVLIALLVVARRRRRRQADDDLATPGHTP